MTLNLKAFLFAFFLFFNLLSTAQNSNLSLKNKGNTSSTHSVTLNYLINKSFVKYATSDRSSSTTLIFQSSNKGLSISNTRFNGKDLRSEIPFTYIVKGTLLRIIYKDDSATEEEYKINLISNELISTHLKGYIDGNFGYIKYQKL